MLMKSMEGVSSMHDPSEFVSIPVGPTKKVVVIGAGFAGLSAACCLAKDGFDVTVLERLPDVGGRCRAWKEGGYTFDMGPSWYWMPDVFDDWFSYFGRQTSQYLELQRLDPPYRLFMSNGRPLDIPDRAGDLQDMFEKKEAGAGAKFRSFMQQAEYKYRVAMSDYVRRPSLHLWEFFDIRMLRESLRLQMFKSQASHVRSYFKHPDLVSIMEWPVLFLGGSPKNVPAMYSMMNYAAIQLGTWYPKGGLYQVPQAMKRLAQEFHVKIKCGDEYEAQKICVEGERATGVQTAAGFFEADFVVAAGDYHHMEQHLLDARYRNLSEEQWSRFVMSPSSLVFYLGISKRLSNLRHHNLFFDEDLEQHAKEIYDAPSWPSRPLFYVEKYYKIVMERLERHTGQEIQSAVVIKRSYAMRDFENDYRSYKGNAYGLANILMQTAVFKPPVKCRKLDNLYFAGQLTVPGPGMPPALISGQIVAKLIKEHGLSPPFGLASSMSGRALSYWKFLAVVFVLLFLLLLFNSLHNLKI
ncbi:hypothetical protein GUITHDRAFT_116060 [Guillardia theta CCMP2712]|uniref:Amine oxidase domain-containing protein n=1 Tax=Guillardia theta (strain CCMP2712) TaxID=905079 RepID=L1INB1_GUITC|nr:hypothetical protein GUITHDRAFT_116060 [Guillardia theta CCMP2712]EKX37753.1 hypothetical protein GUITHDRAFT_116060 [Guillardia theta CCMP2712]|eukprot:XP_005824733.1 hypothetical protein GUITHDRAFT_116060 [Guillardia theta CCMP2712]